MYPCGGTEKNEAMKFPRAPELRPRASRLGSWTKEALRTLNALCFQKEIGSHEAGDKRLTSEVPTPSMFLVSFSPGPSICPENLRPLQSLPLSETAILDLPQSS